ncbi:uncharacterized protein BDZ99DRAFT_459387 [Mytilinidion resinicola]|uniref:Uncharacterized protein n=1 Tax=Mytilinidion resinicola TaxID=574789 RepID=A0A6A6Z3F0_9PEZI|nr:uncharacterized protein BDZ99DRAFT_459387 [Mytilinidion resinicola]KAF2815540.1 hypothetical protein BDZ99DRAFT_459387 [Mytilinidion resinicola]
MANNAANAANEDWETPTKAKVQGAIEYNKAKGITGENEDVFRNFKVFYARGYSAFVCSKTTQEGTTITQMWRREKA